MDNRIMPPVLLNDQADAMFGYYFAVLGLEPEDKDILLKGQKVLQPINESPFWAIVDPSEEQPAIEPTDFARAHQVHKAVKDFNEALRRLKPEELEA